MRCTPNSPHFTVEEAGGRRDKRKGTRAFAKKKETKREREIFKKVGKRKQKKKRSGNREEKNTYSSPFHPFKVFFSKKRGREKQQKTLGDIFSNKKKNERVKKKGGRGEREDIFKARTEENTDKKKLQTTIKIIKK